MSGTLRLPSPGLWRRLTQPVPPQATSMGLAEGGAVAGHRRGQPRVTAPSGLGFSCVCQDVLQSPGVSFPTWAQGSPLPNTDWEAGPRSP